jgi:hypothetical protein
MKKLLFVFGLIALAACDSDDSTSSLNANFAGTWNLQTVNGVTVPFVVQATNPKVELVSEQLTVTSAGTFSIVTNRRNTSTTGAVTNQVQTDAGTYTTSGSTTTFKFNTGNVVPATLSGNTLTLTAATGSSVYTR